MATMAKIREMSPYLLGAIAVLFIGFMVISDTDVPTLMNQGRAESIVGEVNGQQIFYNEFEQKVRDAVELRRQQLGPDADIDEAPIRDQVWNQLVDEILLRQEAEKLGIIVSKEELSHIMLNDPPEFLKNWFRDSTGQFNQQAYFQIMTNPEVLRNQLSPEQYNQTLKQLLQIEDYVRNQRMSEHLQTAVGAAYSIVAPSYLQRKSDIDKRTIDINYIALKTALINDDEVEVTDEELRQLYEKIKDQFEQKPVRKLKYITLPIQPSDLDTQKADRKITRLSNALNEAPSPNARDSVFDVFNVEFGGKSNDFQLANEVSPEHMAFVSSLQERQVIGPVRLQDGTYFFRLDGRRSGENEVVKASHILVNINNNQDSAKAVADDLYQRAKSGEDFATLARENSQDFGSGRNGGDLGYFGRGQMVKPFEDAAFAAEIGSILAPVESQFGYHIIYVVDKKSDELAYSEIRVAPKVSPATENTLFREARAFRAQVADGAEFDTIANRNQYTVGETAFFEKNTPVLNSRGLTGFAFANDIGEVSEPLLIKNTGIVVAQVVDARSEGVQPFEDVTDQVRRRALLSKKLDMLKPRIEALHTKVAAAGSLNAAKSADSTIDVQTVAGVKDDGNIPGYGRDYAATSKAFAMEVGQTSEPIRGENGYFIIHLRNRKDNAGTAENAQLDSLFTQEAKLLQTRAFNTWLNETRENADIVDNRSTIYTN